MYYAYDIEAHNNTTSAVQLLSTAMADDWLSFIVSQTLNDGKGLLRAFSAMPVSVMLPLIGNVQGQRGHSQRAGESSVRLS